MHREGRTSLVSQGRKKWGQTADSEGSVSEGTGSGSTELLREGGRQEGQSHSPVQEQQGCPHPFLILLPASCPAPQPWAIPVPTEWAAWLGVG